MDDAVSDLVLDWRLDSTIVSDSCTQETKYVSNPMTGLWRTRVQETWKRTELLGKGSFGYVWLEQCIAGPRAGKARAVKEIRTRCGSTAYDPLFLSRELLAIMKFSHQRYRDCFVRSFGWYDTPDAIYITMEYLPLGDLQSYITRGRLKEAEAKRITLQILQGIAFMHQSGFAHRDIKPSNILIQHTGPNWWVKIADFGTSKQIEATALRTQTGTQAYLAPEVLGIFPPGDRKISSAPAYSLAVDIWAIGIVAYRIAVGRLPFPEPANLTGYVFYGDSFPVDALLSPECTSFITSVLSTSPRLRPTAAQALESGWINASSPGPASRSPPPRNIIALPLISRDHGGPGSSDPELVTQIRASPLPPQESSGFSAPDVVPVKKFEEMNVSDEEASGRWTTMYNDPATHDTHEHGTAAETSIDSKNDGISEMISDSSNKDGDLVAGRFDFVAKDTNSDSIPVANDTFDDNDVDINTDSQGEKVDKTWGNSVWHYDEKNCHDRATSSDKNDQWWVDAASEGPVANDSGHNDCIPQPSDEASPAAIDDVKTETIPGATIATDPPAALTFNLSTEEKRVYGQLFRQADSEAVGVIVGETAVRFFQKTRLGPFILGEIWQIADKENRGFLTPAAFAIALRLVGHAQAGREPTPKLALQQAPLPRFDGSETEIYP